MHPSKTSIGTIVSLDLPQITSHLSSLGFDFIFIDLEHGHVSDASISAIILSKQKACKVFIRINEISESAIKHALDLGCDGIVAPRVESLHELQILTDYAYYPPVGKRSIGFGMANQYGLKFKEYLDSFRPAIYPQIESEKGLAMAKDILSNEQVTGVFIGPYDLSLSLGVAGKFESETFKNACASIRSLCLEYQKHYCTFTADIPSAINEIENHANMVAVGVDANLFLNTYQQIINRIKDR